MTKDDGTSSEIYYSTKVNMQVKELDYLPNGNLALSLELLSYNVVEPMSTPTPTVTITSQPTNSAKQVATSNPTKLSIATSTPTTKDDPPTASSKPITPEFPTLAILPLFLFVLSTVTLLRIRNQVKKRDRVKNRITTD